MDALLSKKDYFEVDDFFTAEECDKYISYIDRIFGENLDEEAMEIDGYNRLRVDNDELSRLVENKLLEKYDGMTNVYLGKKWFPTRYIRDGGLCIHTDGSAYDEDNSSLYTLVIYLNDNYSGGRTVFVDDYDDEEAIRENSVYVTPKRGKLLVLKQNSLHFAEKVENGVKYILRGDIFIKDK